MIVARKWDDYISAMELRSEGEEMCVESTTYSLFGKLGC